MTTAQFLALTLLLTVNGVAWSYILQRHDAKRHDRLVKATAIKALDEYNLNSEVRAEMRCAILGDRVSSTDAGSSPSVGQQAHGAPSIRGYETRVGTYYPAEGRTGRGGTGVFARLVSATSAAWHRLTRRTTSSH